MFLWQVSIYPVLGLGSETINNVNNNGLNTKIVVQRGETLWHLAQKHQTTVEELVKLNQVKKPDRIRDGQTLWVPNKEIKAKSDNIGTLDVKDYSEEVMALSKKVSVSKEVSDVEKVEVAHKSTDISWWLSILRNIPALATVYQQGYNTAGINGSTSAMPQSTIQTYEIFVNPETELPEKVPASSVLDTKQDVQKAEIPKALPAIASESQLHSRGLGRLVSEEEIELLSRVIYGEARGEDFLGQVAVGAVVLNRLKDPRFPNTIPGIVYQSGAFTAVDDRQIHLDPNDQAYKAAEAALSGLDPTNGAIFYYNPRTATDKWIKSRTVIKRIGNHTFSI